MKFTYEPSNHTNRLETFEWNNLWLDRITSPELPRVLYIGDSISCNTRLAATAAADNKILFDGFGTSKALDNPFFLPELELFAAQQGKRSIVVFNNGLHGYHLDDKTEYPKYLEEMLIALKERFEGTPIALLLTTSVKNEEEDKRVVKRNIGARAVAEKLELPVIDFYAVSKAIPDLYFCDGVHFSEEGYKKLGEYLLAAVKEIATDL